jgi:hypothetical protein
MPHEGRKKLMREVIGLLKETLEIMRNLEELIEIGGFVLIFLICFIIILLIFNVVINLVRIKNG